MTCWNIHHMLEHTPHARRQDCCMNIHMLAGIYPCSHFRHYPTYTCPQADTQTGRLSSGSTSTSSLTNKSPTICLFSCVLVGFSCNKCMYTHARVVDNHKHTPSAIIYSLYHACHLLSKSCVSISCVAYTIRNHLYSIPCVSKTLKYLVGN